MSASNAIALYEKLFYVFAGMGVISLGLSIFLFFRFDIPQTYALMTGKARRRTIQEIEERNAQTGKLRQHPKGYTENPTSHTAKRRRPSGHTGRTEASGKTQPTPQREAKHAKPAQLPAPVERLETEVLAAPAVETVILSKPVGITEDLGQTEILQPVQDVNFYFQITENTVSIHTDELI